VGWTVRLVEAGAEGPGVEIMEISWRGDLSDIGNLGMTLAEAKQLLPWCNERSPPRRRESTRPGGRFAAAATGFPG
jgi:hypothetical protein